MACCGQRRTPINPAIPTFSTRRPLQVLPTARTEPRRRGSTVYFEYVGKTGLTVFGSVTGKRYRFSSNGAVVAVDLRDQPSLLAVPLLKKV